MVGIGVRWEDDRSTIKNDEVEDWTVVDVKDESSAGWNRNTFSLNRSEKASPSRIL
jgi:hypothetical protein